MPTRGRFGRLRLRLFVLIRGLLLSFTPGGGPCLRLYGLQFGPQIIILKEAEGGYVRGWER